MALRQHIFITKNTIIIYFAFARSSGVGVTQMIGVRLTLVLAEFLHHASVLSPFYLGKITGVGILRVLIPSVIQFLPSLFKVLSLNLCETREQGSPPYQLFSHCYGDSPMFFLINPLWSSGVSDSEPLLYILPRWQYEATSSMVTSMFEVGSGFL